MRVYVYRAKQDPLKRLSLECPKVYTVCSPGKTYLDTVRLQKYIYDCAPCKPPCYGVTRSRSCYTQECRKEECIDSSTDFYYPSGEYVPGDKCKILI